jgi:hypothetical protein
VIGSLLTQRLRRLNSEHATETLKRNFLFRDFFRQRGFYDLDSISPEGYLAGALEGKGRMALRIWIDASSLFGRDSNGNQQLTAEGRRRIDSAISDFARYPCDSPIVLEGYAGEQRGRGGISHLHRSGLARATT